MYRLWVVGKTYGSFINILCPCWQAIVIRDWSSIMGKGGGYKTLGRGVKFYPYRKGGATSFSHAESQKGVTKVSVS